MRKFDTGNASRDKPITKLERVALQMAFRDQNRHEMRRDNTESASP